MNKYFFVLLSILIFSGIVTAQNQSDGYNKVEIFAGYSGGSYIGSDDSIAPFDHGFNVAAVYNVHRYVGIKVDVSGTFTTKKDNYFAPFGTPPIPASEFRADHSLYNATAGVQFKNNSHDARFKPFAHILVGVAKHADKFTTSCPAGAVCPPFDRDYTGRSVIVGGGLDFKINRRIDIRAAQLDVNVISTHIGVQDAQFENLRFSSGIIFKF